MEFLFIVPVREGGIDYSYQKDLINMANEELIDQLMNLENDNKEMQARIEKYENGRKSEIQTEKIVNE